MIGSFVNGYIRVVVKGVLEAWLMVCWGRG